jgi:2-dehydropantoate 2-reductase
LKICILGAGALGSAIGGVLTEAGNVVWLVNRSQPHIDAMRQSGLTLRENGVDRMVRVHATTDCREIATTVGAVDLVIVLVKSFHTQGAIEAALPIIAANTVVLSLQNGLGHEDILALAVGRERVLAGKTYAGGVMLAPGHVIVGTEGKETIIGELDGATTERVGHVAAVFNGAGLLTEVSDNIMATIWEKLLVNVATGALSGITGLTYGDLYQIPEIASCAEAAVSEAMSVAKANGIKLTTTDARLPWIKAAAGLPPEFKASMLQSLEKGSITEVDYVNGSVVRWGAKVGVPTPVNQALVACIKGVERALSKSISGASV